MELKIGINIKRFRQNKGLTQAELAKLLNVSCAAVSKWETLDSYPDITMIFPIANILGISIDELMGYNEEKFKQEAKEVLTTYQRLQSEGKWKEASELLFSARKKHPNDYIIALTYILDIIGGSADNSPDVIITQQDEILNLCNFILDGCMDIKLRLETITIKAKLLHATGKTSEALEIVSTLPSWYLSKEQKCEQLFAKNTPEFRYKNRRNLYELSSFVATKAVRNVFYSDNANPDFLIPKCENIGDSFYDIYRKTGEVFALTEAVTIYAELASKATLHYNEKINDIIKIRKKQFEVMNLLSQIANEDIVLHEYLTAQYKTTDLASWLANYLKSAPQIGHAKLQENPDYIAMIEEFFKE